MSDVRPGCLMFATGYFPIVTVKGDGIYLGYEREDSADEAVKSAMRSMLNKSYGSWHHHRMVEE